MFWSVHMGLQVRRNSSRAPHCQAINEDMALNQRRSKVCADRYINRSGKVHNDRCSKLRLDGRLIDDRPYLRNPARVKSIEDIFGERDSPSVHVEAEKLSLGRTVEKEPACDIGRVGDKALNVEVEVWNFQEILFQHLTVAGKSEPPVIMALVVVDEAAEVRPVLFVQTGDIVPVDIGEIAAHGERPCFTPTARKKCSSIARNNLAR